jgi:hypothetical protein
VNRRVQIVISQPGSQQPGASPAQGPLSRLKLLLGGILFAALAIGILIVALILGSIIAAVLWISLVAVIVTLILRAAVRQAHK